MEADPTECNKKTAQNKFTIGTDYQLKHFQNHFYDEYLNCIPAITQPSARDAGCD